MWRLFLRQRALSTQSTEWLLKFKKTQKIDIGNELSADPGQKAVICKPASRAIGVADQGKLPCNQCMYRF
jgi:hypothetical protein